MSQDILMLFKIVLKMEKINCNESAHSFKK